MRIESTGQFTIPPEVLEAAGMKPGAEVELVVEPSGIRLIHAEAPNASQPRRSRAEMEAAIGVFAANGGALGLDGDAYMKLVRGDWADEPPSVWRPDVSDRL